MKNLNLDLLIGIKRNKGPLGDAHFFCTILLDSSLLCRQRQLGQFGGQFVDGAVFVAKNLE